MLHIHHIESVIRVRSVCTSLYIEDKFHIISSCPLYSSIQKDFNINVRASPFRVNN